MPDRIVDGGFETGAAEHVYAAGAARTDFYPHAGLWSLYLPKEVADISGGRWDQTLSGVVPGVPVDVSCWVDGTWGGAVKVLALVDDDADGSFHALGSVDGGAAWAPWTVGSFVPTVANPTIRLINSGEINGRFFFVDDIAAVQAEEGLVAALIRQIKAGAIAAVQSVTTGNGYGMTIAEVVGDPVPSSGIEAYPHVQVLYGVDDEEDDALSYTRHELMLVFRVFCKSTTADDDCADVCEAIEEAIQKKDGTTQKHFGIANVDNVKVVSRDPWVVSEEMLTGGWRLWDMVAVVRYSHARLQ